MKPDMNLLFLFFSVSWNVLSDLGNVARESFCRMPAAFVLGECGTSAGLWEYDGGAVLGVWNVCCPENVG